ncbi:HNH endonuclease [Paracoccus sp. (in: a-proteobacteria)]|uniref:HNH endonuclease n=1 Tax=Paracoccus sp. TaxID=267 RepID=UPI003A87B91A
MGIDPVRKPSARPTPLAPQKLLPSLPANKPAQPPTSPPASAPTFGPSLPEPHARGSAPAAKPAPERQAEIDRFVTENARHQTKVGPIRLDSNGGERVGEALRGDSSLGRLTPAERTYLAEESVKAWDGQTDDNGGRRENIDEAVDAVRGDSAASRTLARALAAPALGEDDAIRTAGAIITAEGTTQRHGEMFDAAAKLDIGAVAQSYQGNETALSRRLANTDQNTRQNAWSLAADPGRLTEQSQQALATSLFFADKGGAGASPEYRRKMAEAIALARQPGDSPQDKMARDVMASNIADVMETEGGRDMLLSSDATTGSRLWALNEVARGDVRLDARQYDGLEAPALANAPGNPGAAASGGQPSEGEVYADLAQMALDVSGIVDPTPVSDGANALISLFRGKIGDALISAAGMVPYLGDLAKVGKLEKWVKTIENVVDLAGRSAKFMDKVRPMLEGLQKALKAIPESVLGKLPKSAQDAIQGMISKLDDAIAAGARRAPLVVDDAVGSAKQLPDGRVIKVGDSPTVNRRPDGSLEVTKANGTTGKINEPRTDIDSTKTVTHADGSATYTKTTGETLTYDADGFPVFDSKADIFLDAQHIGTGSKSAHFKASNEALREELTKDPGLKEKMGLTDQQYDWLMEGSAKSSSPPGLTWHHHQDTGKMQLVDKDIHADFGHLGGMSIWGKS